MRSRLTGIGRLPRALVTSWVAQLQERLKANLDLVPLDEFGLTGPLMVAPFRSEV